MANTGKGKLGKGILSVLQGRALKHGEEKYKEGYCQALLDAAAVAEYFDIERHDVEAEYLFRMLAARFRQMAEEE